MAKDTEGGKKQFVSKEVLTAPSNRIVIDLKKGEVRYSKSPVSVEFAYDTNRKQVIVNGNFAQRAAKDAQSKGKR